jgi:replication factor A1
MTKISELMPKQGKVAIEASVTSISNVREFNKFGKIGRVANATLQDESGEVKLTLWNEEIDKVKAGNTIRIRNGYVNEWQGQKQLMVGRFGDLEVVK